MKMKMKMMQNTENIENKHKIILARCKNEEYREEEEERLIQRIICGLVDMCRCWTSETAHHVRTWIIAFSLEPAHV